MSFIAKINLTDYTDRKITAGSPKIIVTDGSGVAGNPSIDIDVSEININDLLPDQTGNSGKFLSTDGADASWQSISTGTQFEIGTIIDATDAPSDSGTWLECNGQILSQDTYSSLFAEIGHNYIQYVATRSAAPSSNFIEGSSIVWTGSKWLLVKSSSTQTYQSTDGITWSSNGTLPSSISPRVCLVSAGNGTVMAYSVTSQDCFVTTDHGTTWATGKTNPDAVWFNTVKYNGIYWVRLGSYNPAPHINYTTNPLTTNWTQATFVLPDTSRAGNVVVWDGSYWIILPGVNYDNVVARTNVSTGASGWTDITSKITEYGYGVNPDAINTSTNNYPSSVSSNGNGTVISCTGRGSVFVSHDHFDTIKVVSGPRSSGIFSVAWNGYAFVYFDHTSNLVYISVDGEKWESSDIGLPIGSFLDVPTIGDNNVNAYYGARSSSSFNTSNGSFVAFSTTNTKQYVWIVEPTADLSTEFNIPDKKGKFIKVA